MTRAEMLNEHLDTIYLMEAINFSKVKGVMKRMRDAAVTHDLMKMKKATDLLPDTNSSTVVSLARKKLKHFRHSEKTSARDLKKVPDEVSDLAIAGQAAVMELHEETKDPEVREQLGRTLEEMKDSFVTAASNAGAYGISMVGIAGLIKIFVKASATAAILAPVGKLLIAASIILFVIAIFINLMMKARKMKERFIK